VTILFADKDYIVFEQDGETLKVDKDMFCHMLMRIGVNFTDKFSTHSGDVLFIFHKEVIIDCLRVLNSDINVYNNKAAIVQLGLKYGKICMYGGNVSTNNPLTFHHCLIPKKDGGISIEDNGSLACHLEHSGVEILSNNVAWCKRLKEYIIEYKSLLKKDMSVQQFINLKEREKLAYDMHKEIEQELFDLGMDVFQTKDCKLFYKKKK